MIRAATLALGAALACGGTAGSGHGESNGFAAPSLNYALIPDTVLLLADRDATVHDGGRWRWRALGDRDWLMVGAAPTRRHLWFSYIGYDISVVPAEATIEEATLVMTLDGFPMGDGESASEFEVHSVVGEWDESTLVWARQPRVSSLPIARLRLSDDLGYAEADVSQAFADGHAAGESRVDLVVVPRDASVNRRVRYRSRESSDVDTAFGEGGPVVQLLLSARTPAQAESIAMIGARDRTVAQATRTENR